MSGSDSRTALALLFLASAACESNDAPFELGADVNLSALTETAAGFHFYPPLSPMPSYSGTFDGAALDALSVEIQELDTVGGDVLRTVATFNRNTTPRLSLVAAHEVYFLNLRAADYLTAPERTYRFRVLGAGRTLGFSDLSDQVWGFLSRYPNLMIGVKMRVEVAACATIAPDSIADNCDGADNDCDGSIDEDMIACDDGNPCTEADTCRSGTCAGTELACAAADQCRDAGTCDPATGACTNPVKAPGSACVADDGDSGECMDGACVPTSGIRVFTAVTAPANTVPIISLGQIPAVAGKRINILRLGICGDADVNSGLQGFRAYDNTSIDFTWGAGQANQSGAQYFLAPTPATNGTGRGFSYQDVNLHGALGAGLSVEFYYRNDWDAHYCDAFDEFGNYYYDAPGANVRVWLKYQYVDLQGSPCDDGNACTQTDIYQNGACAGTNPVVCTALDACHAPGVCNPANGVCSNPNAADGTSCSDGNPCTQTDSCHAGSCTGGNPITCTTTAECQVSSCNPANGQCVNSNAPSGTICPLPGGGVGACYGAYCAHDLYFSSATPGTALPILQLGQIPALPGRHIQVTRIGICGDADTTSGLQGFRATDGAGTSFTWGAGQSNQGGVQYFLSPTPLISGNARGFSYQNVNIFTPAGRPLDVSFDYRYDWDGRYCDATDERGTRYTDPASSVRAWVRYRYIDECAIDGAPCNDGNACTQSDVCQGGVCVGSNPVVCTASNQCHDAGVCNPSTGVCSNPSKADGTSCNDGTLCTQTDSCQGGECVGTNPVMCTALDACHLAACDGTTGMCINPNAPNGTSCGAFASCTSGACLPTVYKWSAVTPGTAIPIISMGQLPAQPGYRISITRIGICGDADSTSGLQGFRAYDGAALDFSWGAGQSNQGGVNHFLSPTPALSGSARGFSYLDVSRTGGVGRAVNIDFQHRYDWDGRFCQTTDEDGQSYSDGASTARAWVKYSYVP